MSLEEQIQKLVLTEARKLLKEEPENFTSLNEAKACIAEDIIDIIGEKYGHLI
jgi:hypothetical protein